MKSFTQNFRRRAVLLVSSVGLASAVCAADLSGAGATFPYPAYAKWADVYKKQTGVGLNYQSIGSGGGIKQIKAKTVTFGASDKPLESKELQAAGLIQFPMIMGGVVPVMNVKGITAGQLELDGPTLASIYLGEITQWNDKAIQALNPKLKLPDTAIAPVYRSDGSGTNFLFTNYLSQVNPTFASKIGANTSVEWPAGIGAKGNEGVANMSKLTEGAIGYVEYAYAVQNKMTYIKLKNLAGKFVEPKSSAFQAAAANADWAHADGFYLVLTNQPGEKSWPITGASFILMYKQPGETKDTLEALKFFDWAYKHGAKLAEELDYVPMPEAVIKLVEQSWKSEIKTADGKLVWGK